MIQIMKFGVEESVTLNFFFSLFFFGFHGLDSIREN